MIIKFPKIFKGNEQESEAPVKDNAEVTAVDQNSNDQLYEQTLSVTEGQVTIHFSNASSADGALMVGFFIGNGFSEKVKFNKVPLVLLDSNRKVLAQQTFSGESIGDVTGGTVKACVVRFKPENVYTKDIPEECEVRFDVRSKQPKESKQPIKSENIKFQYQVLPKDISVKQQQDLEQILAKLQPMGQGEANFSPLCATITKQNKLLATVIIRNSTKEQMSFEQIPLVFIDAKQDEIARAIFDIKTIEIQPYKAILWTFDFGDVGQDKDIDLSSWKINVVQA